VGTGGQTQALGGGAHGPTVYLQGGVRGLAGQEDDAVFRAQRKLQLPLLFRA